MLATKAIAAELAAAVLNSMNGSAKAAASLALLAWLAQRA
jgi:hypothetical protein